METLVSVEVLRNQVEVQKQQISAILGHDTDILCEDVRSVVGKISKHRSLLNIGHK